MVNEALKRIRRYRGLTQSEVAEKLGISRSQYNRIENGVCEPGIRMAIRLGLVLYPDRSVNLAISDIFGSMVFSEKYKLGLIPEGLD